MFGIGNVTKQKGNMVAEYAVGPEPGNFRVEELLIEAGTAVARGVRAAFERLGRGTMYSETPESDGTQADGVEGGEPTTATTRPVDREVLDRQIRTEDARRQSQGGQGQGGETPAPPS